MWRVLWWLLKRPRFAFDPRQAPPGEYPETPPPRGDVRVFFIGHSTLLIEMGGLRILTDPVFSDHCSPFKWSGTKRYRAPGLTLDQLPPIDVVLTTHNHYDHLDDPSIRYLGDGPEYVVPLGLGDWFAKRGCRKIHELDWWESIEIGDCKLTATPSQHWSKRTFFDRNKSLWCGYAVESSAARVLFIGDSGYCDAFKEIGQRLGPFHIAALPIGGYDPASIMSDAHMTPEEALEAFEDVGAGVLLPTHYNAFYLTDEPIGEPPRRLYHAWLELGLDVDHLWILAPGEHRSLEDITYIPTVRALGPRHDTPREPRRPLRSIPLEEQITEWGISICPFKGDMVDLEVAGHRDSVFQGDEGQTLTLDEVRCSGFGDIDECGGSRCPLRDPAFLRSHHINGVEMADGHREPFIEFEMPPSPNWWREELIICGKEDDQGRLVP